MTGYTAASKFDQARYTLIDQVGQNMWKGVWEMTVVIIPACPPLFLDVAVDLLLEDWQKGSIRWHLDLPLKDKSVQ